MSVCFHPEHPAVVAAGTFGGQVVVWNTARTDDPLVGTTRVSEYGHREPVVGLSWLFDYGRREHLLVSISGDGKVFMWTMKNKLVTPVEGWVASRARRAHLCTQASALMQAPRAATG